MKKILTLICTLCMCAFMSTALAATVTGGSGVAGGNNAAITGDNGAKVNSAVNNWEISMQPKPTEKEIEAARWSLILENDLGIYAFDRGSMSFAEVKGEADTNVVDCTVKTLFTNKDILKKLQEVYAKKLKGKEKVSYCLMDMEYKMAEGQYTVKKMEVFTDKGRLIETQTKENAFAAIPEGSFAEALYEICQQYVAAVTGVKAEQVK